MKKSNWTFCFLTVVLCLGLGACANSDPIGGGGFTLSSSKISITQISPTSISLSWPLAVKEGSSTPLAYALYQTVANPAHNTFNTIDDVETGSLIAIGEDIASFTETSTIISGNAYYFNVVVTDIDGDSLAYTPVGAYFDSSLLLYYGFSGSSNDLSPAANNGVLNGSPTLTTDRFGNANSAYTFVTASNQFIKSTANLNITGADPRTLSFWFQGAGNSYTYSNNDRILSLGTDAAGEVFGAFVSGSTNGHIMLWGNGADVDSGQTFTTNWEHWAITYDGTNVVGYKNGAQVATGAETLNTGGGTATPLYIGSSPTPDTYLTGSVDSVSVYSAALTSAEISALYTVTSP